MSIDRHSNNDEFQAYAKMKIHQIHHVAIICSNYNRSKHFYTEILGFSIIKETFRAARNSYKILETYRDA